VVLVPALQWPEVTQIDEGRASLRGLPGVAVVAEQVSSDIRPYGLGPEWIESRVTAALQREAIPLLPRSDALSSQRQPLLVARIQTLRFPGRQSFAWHCSLALHQNVVVSGTSAPGVLASTWQATATIGICSGKSLRASLGETLDQQAAEFGRDWKRRETED
jgi:hypothetical protein